MQKLKFICAALLAITVFSCNSNDNQKEETVYENVTDTSASVSTSDSAKTIINRSMIWSVQPAVGAENEKLKAPQNVKLDTLSSIQLADLINTNYPDIHLDVIKISHDTIYVKIPDSKRLANDIGDTGAENYLASATFTLTELKNVKYVNFALKAGNHAGPGVYSRNDFKRLR